MCVWRVQFRKLHGEHLIYISSFFTASTFFKMTPYITVIERLLVSKCGVFHQDEASAVIRGQ